MSVIAIHLGEGFLENGTPEGAIVAQMRKECHVVKFALGAQRQLHGQVVIHDHCVGHSERVQVYSVDA